MLVWHPSSWRGCPHEPPGSPASVAPDRLLVVAGRTLHGLVQLRVELLPGAVGRQVQLVGAGAGPREALLCGVSVREDVDVKLGYPSWRQPRAGRHKVQEPRTVGLVHLQQVRHQVFVRGRLLAEPAHGMQVGQQRLLVPLDAVLAAEHLPELRAAEGDQALEGERVVDPRPPRRHLRRDAGVEPKSGGLVRKLADVLHGHSHVVPAGTERCPAEACLQEASAHRGHVLLERGRLLRGGAVRAVRRRQEALREVHALRLRLAPRRPLLRSGQRRLPRAQLARELRQGPHELAGAAAPRPRQARLAQRLPQHEREELLGQRQGHDEALPERLAHQAPQEPEALHDLVLLGPVDQRLQQQAPPAQQVLLLGGAVVLHPHREGLVHRAVLESLGHLHVERLRHRAAEAGLPVELHLHEVAGARHEFHRYIGLAKELLALGHAHQGALQRAQPEVRLDHVLLDIGQLLRQLLNLARVVLRVQLRLHRRTPAQEGAHLALLRPVHGKGRAEGGVL
mmetsp:Transcript_98630/g.275496  ORF Transcript_98630/g.275496 Transcript_98630/m.275496 type:complete len:510 (-) Transcript_98630:579-2108(-)